MSDSSYIWVSTSTSVEIGGSWVLGTRFEVGSNFFGLEVSDFVEVAESTTGGPVGVLEAG